MTARAHVGAAIDVGSNSIHLLVAWVGRSGPRLRPILDESAFLGLGAVVDREGRLSLAARREATSSLAAFVERARAAGAVRVDLLATEPLRRASNRSLLRSDVLAATGLPLRVLSHEVEAELTLLGVLGGHPAEEPTLVMDIGGGSTELVLVGPGEDPVVGAMPVGSARLTAGFVEHDPPSWLEIGALRAEAARLFAGLPGGHATRGVVVGGSGTNLVRLADGELPATVDRERIERALWLVASQPAAKVAADYGLHERRARQMAAGAVLIEAALSRYGLDSVEVSSASLREGAVLAGAICGDAWPERLSTLVSRGARPGRSAPPRGPGVAPAQRDRDQPPHASRSHSSAGARPRSSR